MATPIVPQDRRTRRNAQSKAWRARNKERVSAYNKLYAVAHRNKIREKNTRYSKKHKAQWRLYFRLYEAVRRARKRNAPVCDLTAAQWEEIKAAYGHRCVYCGRKMQRLTQDHITPLSKGGSHTASNVVPACKSCNCRKNAGDVLCPVQPLLLTIA